MHLAHPLGVKGFAYRRVKNDVRDATDLADLLRMGRLPEAWIAPPATRELRELVRHRAKLVALRSGCKCEVHAVLAKLGVQVPMTDLFADRGLDLLERLDAPAPYVARIQSLQRLIDVLDVEVDLFARLARGRLAADPGYRAVQTIPGIGPVLAAVFVAEIGDVHRFPTAAHLASWAGLTPKHRESDTHVRRGRITKQGSRLVRWAAVESVKRLGPHTGVGPLTERVADRRGRNIGTVAAARRQVEHVYYALRDGHVRAAAGAPEDGQRLGDHRRDVGAATGAARGDALVDPAVGRAAQYRGCHHRAAWRRYRRSRGGGRRSSSPPTRNWRPRSAMSSAST